LAKEKVSNLADREQAPDIDHFKKRLDMLDQRLDNIDSIVTAVVERVMKQPVTFNITCSKCGRNIEIALVGIEKPTK
jgi:tetrahydromethanopterin S-methyltransferase subunit G